MLFAVFAALQVERVLQWEGVDGSLGKGNLLDGSSVHGGLCQREGEREREGRGRGGTKDKKGSVSTVGCGDRTTEQRAGLTFRSISSSPKRARHRQSDCT